MKAMVLKEYNNDLLQENVPDPVPDAGEVVLQVRACGMCFTDVKITTGQLKSFINLPHIPGHEIAGEVVALGAGVNNVKVGDKGVVYFILNCGYCEFCLSGEHNLCATIKRIGFEKNGGYAQYVKLPASNLALFTSNTPYETMAVIPDAVATPYHALVNMARLKVGQRLLVVGAGGLGLNAVQIGVMMGLKVFVADMNETALQTAKDLGAMGVINTKTYEPREAAKELTSGAGFDVVLEGVGYTSTMDWTLKSLKKGGTLIIMGYDPVNPVPIELIHIHNNQWHIVGTKVSTKQGLAEAVRLVETGKVIPKITEKIVLADVNSALAALKKGGRVGRTVINVF
jgi:propanol-preferring alcohol dehydrogenase